MKGIRYLMFSASMLMAGCGLIDQWSPGEMECKTIQITSNIEKIDVGNIFEIKLIQDDNAHIDVICGNNFQHKVEITLKDNILILDHNIKNRWLNGYDKIILEIHIPYLPPINVLKPVKIETQGTFKTETFYLVDWGDYTDCNVSIDVNNLVLHTSGDNFGTYIISGKTKNTNIRGGGSARIDCSALQTETCQLIHQSITDLTINVNEQFDVQIESSGNVYYAGDPTVKLVRNGSGKLIKK